MSFFVSRERYSLRFFILFMNFIYLALAEKRKNAPKRDPEEIYHTSHKNQSAVLARKIERSNLSILSSIKFKNGSRPIAFLAGGK